MATRKKATKKKPAGSATCSTVKGHKRAGKKVVKVKSYARKKS